LLPAEEVSEGVCTTTGGVVVVALLVLLTLSCDAVREGLPASIATAAAKGATATRGLGKGEGLEQLEGVWEGESGNTSDTLEAWLCGREAVEVVVEFMFTSNSLNST